LPQRHTPKERGLKVLITGGSGFIGRNLAEALGSRHEVSAPGREELDLLDAAAVRQYLCAHSFDVVIHSATTRSNRRLGAPTDMLDRNCRMFFNLARNAALFGKMIHFGSGAEYGRDGLPARVREDYFDTAVPADPYGFSKYVCAKFIERADRILDLRLFGVFGKYEAWDVRFISNACCRVVHGLPIVIRQDVRFDYLDVSDLAEITDWFIRHDARHKTYNVCHRRTFTLRELAGIVAEASGRSAEIIVRNPGMQPEYSGDNSRLLAELGDYEFRDMRRAVGELYAWYAANPAAIDRSLLHFDG
jgi:GDP-L-fucose synthase